MAGNILDAKKIVAELNDVWKKQVEVLTQVETNLVKLNEQYKKLPSEYIKQQKDLLDIKNKQATLDAKLLKAEELKQNQIDKLFAKREAQVNKEIALENKKKAETEKAYAQREAQIKKETNLQKKAQQQRELQVKKESDLRQRLLAQRNKEEASELREQTRLAKTQGLYNKVQAGINKLTTEYNNLAIRKELNGRLTAEETVKLGALEAKLNKYQGALKRVDASIGKHQRNVGNYKSGYDGLGWSVAQLSREMPAFANSMQTGFMAISNNIPMLVDEITKLKVANVQLASSGKPTVNILKSVGKAIFSMNGMLGIGITILTVFGPKLIEWASGMTEAEKATEEATNKLEEQNKALKENLALRKRALADTKEFINSTAVSAEFSAIFNNLQGDIVKSESALIELSDRLQKIGAEDYDLLTNLDITQSDRVVIAVNLLEIENQKLKLEEERIRLNDNLTKQKEIQRQYDSGEISKEVKRIKMINLGNTSLATTLDIQTEIQRLKEINLTLLGKEVELENKKKNKDDLKRAKELSVIYKEEITDIEELTKALTTLRDEKLKGSKQYEELSETIEYLNGVVKASNFTLDEAYKKKVSDAEASEKQRLALVKLREEYLKNLEAFREGFVNESFGEFEYFGNLIQNIEETIKMIKEGGNQWEDYFLLISESGQQAYNAISKFRDADFENELTSLEKKYAISTKFAGDNADAKEEIDRQYEEKRARIQARQAKAEKEQAIFNTVINTAQGIVATIGQVGFPAAIPLIVAIGAIGAAQLALINSQSIPEFKDGVVGFSGGLAKVNDAKGSNYKEIIKTPDGKLSMAKGRNALVDLPKGTDVIKASETDSFMRNMYNELALNDIMPFSNSFGASIMPNINANGITKAEIQDVMSKELSKVSNAIKNKSETTLSIDENGINAFSYNNGQKRKMLNARVRRNGRKV